MEKCPREANPECRGKQTFQKVFVAISCRAATPTLFSPASSAEPPSTEQGAPVEKQTMGDRKNCPAIQMQGRSSQEKEIKDRDMDTPSETAGRCVHRQVIGD